MITVWLSFSRTTQVIPSFCAGCCFRNHLFALLARSPVFPLRMLRALPRSLLRGCLGVQIQRGQRSKMVLSDSRAFEALGFQTSFRCTTPTHSQRSLVSDLQQKASELVFFLPHSMIPFATCFAIISRPSIWPNTLTRFLSTWR